jgi:hypothetical protein
MSELDQPNSPVTHLAPKTDELRGDFANSAGESGTDCIIDVYVDTPCQEQRQQQNHSTHSFNMRSLVGNPQATDIIFKAKASDGLQNLNDFPKRCVQTLLSDDFDRF